MSWSAYTDNLVASKVELCAIHSRDGTPWAQVSGFTCSSDEVAMVVRAISTNDSSIYGSGVKMGGKKWTVISFLPDNNLAMFKGKDNDNLKQSLVVALTNTAAIVGANKDDSVLGSQVLIAVEKMKDYLCGCGY